MLKALHYCHKTVQVIHRDIKPDNIMISHNNDAILIDFGVSALVDKQDDDEMKSNVGTYIFYAPEMFERSNTNVTVHGEKTDIWALGVTIFYMITGTYPHNKPDNLIDLRENVVNGKFDWNRIRNEDAK